MKRAKGCALGGALFAALAACSVSSAAPPQWHYQPTGKEVRADIAATSPGPKELPWRPVSLPHVFDKDQREKDVNAWYVADLAVPDGLSPYPMILDLGVIDDADETFMNGTSVGKTGNPDATDARKGSAWRTDRLYVVPADTVRRGANILAVRVKDFSGIGGFLGQPYVGTCLCATGECRYRGSDGDPRFLSSPEFDDSKWRAIPLPLGQDFEASGEYGWYRFRFDVPPALSGRDIPVDLGRVYDAAEVYLNGQSIAHIGTFPPGRFRQTASRLRAILPHEALKAADNLLAVRVFSDAGCAALSGVPSIPLADLDLFSGRKSVKKTLAALGVGAFASFSHLRQLDVCEYLVHSGYAAEAASLCDAISRSSRSPDVTHRARCMQVYALWLAGRTDEAWRCFQGVDFSRHIPYDAATAMADYCLTQADPESGVLYRHKDLTTRGDWPLAYGINHALLCAVGSPFDAAYGLGPRLGVKVSVNDPAERTRSWLGARQTDEARALYYPPRNTRRYACWDDRGEVRPFDEKGPDLVLDLDVPEGTHLLSLYLVDWDWFDTPHPRVESIIVTDAQDHVITVASTGRFGEGQYERFLVQGPRALRLRVTKQRSPCAILSGIFLDTVPPLQATPTFGPPAPREVGLPLPANSDTAAGLRDRYETMRKRSEESVLEFVCSDEFMQFEADVLKAARENPMPEVLWWALECKRLRFNFGRLDQALWQYLEAVKATLPAERRYETFRDLARRFTEARLCPRMVLTTMQYAAAEKKEGAEDEYARLVKASRRGYVYRASAVWRKEQPLPRWIEAIRASSATPER